MINLAGINTIVYARIKTDPAGAAIRAQLGDGAASVVHAIKLRQTPLPPRPFLALRRTAVPRATGLALIIYRWYLYDDLAAGYSRIDALAPMLAEAYDAAPLTLAGHAIGTVEINAAGPQDEDRALNLAASFATLAIYAGGPR